MINALLGQKQDQLQKFLNDGTRIPVTKIFVPANPVVLLKSKDKTGYSAVQLGFGIKRKPNKALLGQAKKAGVKDTPKYLKEIKIEKEEKILKPGDLIKVAEVFEPGDKVDVTGISKGKGFAGVVKRYHFKGGPRTHGQSDRERAPGSIGQSTTPGRVYKGKRMAGRMGQSNVTVKNLEVVDVLDDNILIKGLVPGGKKSILLIKKTGKNKKFIPLFKEESKEEAEAPLRQSSKEQVKEEEK